jgi:hypothetical protein
MLLKLLKKWFKRDPLEIIKEGRFRKFFPWSFIEFAIREYFKEKYPKYDKIALSSQDWVDFDTICEDNHPRLWKIHKICGKIDFFIDHRIIEKIKYPRRFYLNYFESKTHIIPTGLKRGEWHDSSSRLFSGMFELLCFFIEEEDKRGFEYYKERIAEDDYEPDEPHDSVRKDLLEAYHWYKVELPRLREEMDALYKELPDRKEKHIMAYLHNRDPLRDEIYEDISSIEWLIGGQKLYYMHMIVRHEGHLWS